MPKGFTQLTVIGGEDRAPKITGISERGVTRGDWLNESQRQMVLEVLDEDGDAIELNLGYCSGDWWSLYPDRELIKMGSAVNCEKEGGHHFLYVEEIKAGNGGRYTIRICVYCRTVKFD